MDEAAARERLEQMVSASEAPTLEPEEIDTLLDLARRPDVNGNSPLNTTGTSPWAEGEVLAGAVVLADGRYWRARIGGTTGTTEPTWPVLAGWATPAGYGWPSVVGNASEPLRYRYDILDGTVVWEDNGTAWAPTWDLERAAREGWLMKAGKAAGRFDFGEDGQQFSTGQIIAHCRAMAHEFDRPKLGSTRIASC